MERFRLSDAQGPRPCWSSSCGISPSWRRWRSAPSRPLSPRSGDALAKILSSETKLRRKVRDEAGGRRREVRRRPALADRRARRRQGHGRVDADPHRGRSPWSSPTAAGCAPARGTSSTPRSSPTKRGTAFFMAANGEEQPERGLPRFHGPHLLAGRPCPPFGERPGRGPSPATSTPPPGATFVGVMIGGDDDLYLMATHGRLRLHRQAGRPPDPPESRQGRDHRAGKGRRSCRRSASPIPAPSSWPPPATAAACLVFHLKDLPVLPPRQGG